tara:strand:- start:2605 stop:2958 length:354 start_codon:yes stop_codon:yes gene_type:complete
VNDNDLAIVVIAAVLATVFVALFALRSPSCFGAWFSRRLLPGVAGLVGLTGLVSWWLNGVAATDVAACEMAASSYDCEDAFLIVVMAILAGAMATVLFVFGSAGVFAVKRFRQAGAA